MSPAEVRAFTLEAPDQFLRLLTHRPASIDLSSVSFTEMWSLAALAVLARFEMKPALQLMWGANVNARNFAAAVGLDDVINDAKGPIAGDVGRTVRLSRVALERDIQDVAVAVARLLATEDPANDSARYAIQYVLTEMLRNVIQHSDDDQGGVVGAQLNDKGHHSTRPVFQVVVADAGRGIRASLSRTHQEIETDAVALERALWPYVSGAFPAGRSGGEENAGLGLFYISEIAKRMEGRMLLSSGTHSLLIDPRATHRQRLLDCGFPGTLVAFEIPVAVPRNFDELFVEIGQLAEKRTPKRLSHQWLRFEQPSPSIPQYAIGLILENNDEALKLAQNKLIPRLVKKEPVLLNFINVRVCTQSFAHALLYEVLRIAWATQTPIYVVNAAPVVASALKHVETYAQSG